MSNQRPSDTVPHQQEIEAIIDQRLAQSVNLLPMSEGGDLWVVGSELTLQAGWAPNGPRGAGALRYGGRVSWYGSVFRASGDALPILHPFDSVLPEELRPFATYAAGPVVYQTDPDYIDTFVSTYVTPTGDFVVQTPDGAATSALYLFFDGLSYVA